jgi:hypothetical protein
MKQSTRMAGLVAGVMAAALVGGVVYASNRVPVLVGGSGTPFAVGEVGNTPGAISGSPTPRATSSSTTPKAPTASTVPRTTSAATATPKPTATGPVKVTVDLTRLERGAGPSVPYAIGHYTVVSGGLQVRTSGHAFRAARTADGRLLVVTTPGSSSSQLEVFNASGRRVQVVPDVADVKSSADLRGSAYATERMSSSGAYIVGSTLTYQDNASGHSSSLSRPNDTELRILAVVGDTVYFRAKRVRTDMLWSLYRWRAGTSEATTVSGVLSPTALSADGIRAGSLLALVDDQPCSGSVDTATAVLRWETCSYLISAFSRDRRTVLGTQAHKGVPLDGNDPSDRLAAVLDSNAGTLLHEWSSKGTKSTFHRAVFEDDGHVLIQVDQGVRLALIRCATVTGRCELATKLLNMASEAEVFELL